MSNETVITVVGNLTSDPELRFVSSGAAVANFTVASTPRIYDKLAGEWRDGDALFLRVNVWREQAESVAESLSKGMRVVVIGQLRQRSYESNGEKRTVYEVEAEEVAPSLKYAQAKVTKTQRNSNGRAPVGAGARGNNRGYSGQHDDSDAPF